MSAVPYATANYLGHVFGGEIELGQAVLHATLIGDKLLFVGMGVE